MTNPISIAEFRRRARRRLPRAIFDFIDGGSGDERTLRENEARMVDWNLVPAVGVNVSDRCLDTEILGKRARLPLFLAPTGLAGFFWPDGEMAAARAAASAGVPFCLSTNSVASIKEVAAAAPNADLWFQLYPLRDKSLMVTLMGRAKSAGYRVLCVTVDLPLLAKRERDLRNGFAMPLRPQWSTFIDLCLHPAWLLGTMKRPPRFGNFPAAQGESFRDVAKHVSTQFDPSTDWDDYRRIRDSWSGPLILKGIMTPEDAERSVKIGADGIVVSNHGGRQLDGVSASIMALARIAPAVKGRIEILMDGGIRRGTDMAKALALGARACGIGRPFLWGLATNGGAGVERAIDLFHEEFDSALALLGVTRPADLCQAHIQTHQICRY